MRCLGNSRGQSLIEYVILVALVGVACTDAVRRLQAQIRTNMDNVVHGLQGSTHRIHNVPVSERDVHARDFTNFLDGVSDREAR